LLAVASPLPGGVAPASSTRLFHSLQAVHLPVQRAAVTPQF
jgi:hypothetical protein